MPAQLILVAGPYRSGTGDDPALIAQNVAAMTEVSLRLFRAGHLPVMGEWFALPLIEHAGSTSIGDAIFNEIFHPISRRLVARCDGCLRIGGASVGADEMVAMARALGKPVYASVDEIPDRSIETSWEAVDAYFEERLIPADDALDAALATSAAAGLPEIQVTASQGKFLNLLARTCGARRILEIGTLGGYSTIWLARALPPDGQLISLEINPRHADLARQNLARAGVQDRATVWLGPATVSLARLAAEQAPPFDLVFIDADKVNTTVYFDAAVSLSRAGTIIVVDNVVRQGDVLDPSSTDENVRGIRQFVAQLSNDSRVDGVAMQTVGSKGHDGFLMARVIATSPNANMPHDRRETQHA